jgi:hypothetical protein
MQCIMKMDATFQTSYCFMICKYIKVRLTLDVEIIVRRDSKRIYVGNRPHTMDYLPIVFKERRRSAITEGPNILKNCYVISYICA